MELCDPDDPRNSERKLYLSTSDAAKEAKEDAAGCGYKHAAFCNKEANANAAAKRLSSKIDADPDKEEGGGSDEEVG